MTLIHPLRRHDFRTALTLSLALMGGVRAADLPVPTDAVANPTPPTPLDYGAKLDQAARPLSLEKAKLSTLFYTIGKTYNINFNVDATITETAYLHFNGGSIRELLDGLLDANDLFMEVKPGYIEIKRTKNEFYFIEYPQVSRSASSSTSISLSPSGTAGTNAGGVSVVGAGVSPQQNGLNGQQSSGDQTTLSISEKSGEMNVWDGIAADIKSVTEKSERIVLNPFSGIASVDTTVKRHRNFWKTYFQLLNSRINAQVLVEVRIEEFTLNDATKQGIDWTQVSTSIANAVTIGPITTNTNVTTVGPVVLPQDTLLGNFATGKLSAAISALKQQGTMRMITRPSIRLLNNQKGFVKVGDDQSFYTLTNNVIVTSGTTNSQTINAPTYTQTRQTFGVVLPVTAHVSADGWVTLVLEPARTRLNAIDTAPDGKSTSPNTSDQRISTMLRLRDNESTIIGGLSQSAEGKNSRGIPILSGIPYLGALTRTDGAVKSATELLLTVSVKIIR